ncbi:MAG: Acyl carrier protein [Candidatus Heimdallarchaeota archaeon LC_3]|nr:MAG: Acyl carrier protein [Candidatus Heimdallarchaeota archaeon LC_3]
MTSKLTEILEKLFQLPQDKITDNINQETLEAWDSMLHLILITELEESFNIQIEEDDILTMKTVSDIKNVLKKNSVTDF